LNNGLLRAANDIRKAHNLPLFISEPILQKVAEGHAKAMVDDNFYAHKNPYSANLRTMVDRINYVSDNNHGFKAMGENIAAYDIIATEGKYCIVKSKNGNYIYYDCSTKKRIPIYTYYQLAMAVMRGWMNSPSHRDNLLDPNYRYLGTAACLSKNPFQSPKPPFARIVQNFGG
jgi:uncharacterized protein YkwD